MPTKSKTRKRRPRARQSPRRRPAARTRAPYERTTASAPASPAQPPRKPSVDTAALWGTAGKVAGGLAVAAGTVFRAHGGTQIPDDAFCDRAGLAALTCSVIMAILDWSGNSAMAVLPQDVAGILAPVLPVLAGAVAWRLFRSPHRRDVNVRAFTGLAVELAAVCGTAALAAGRPTPLRAQWPQVREAGGLVGWAVTALPGRISAWLAVLVLVLLAAWGTRLLTGMPLRKLLAPARRAEEPGGATVRSEEEDPSGEPADTEETAGTEPTPDSDPGSEAEPGAYVPPRLDVLRPGPKPKVPAEADDSGAAALNEVFQQFDVNAEITDSTRGPSVTRYHVTPGPGVKVEKVTGLEKNIALAAKTDAIRILPVIPGTSAIGIEVPNASREIVTLGGLLRSPEARADRHPLTVAAGKDVEGRPVLANIGKMPHAIAAGTTGSGKSVFIKALITSLLMRTTPDQVRLLLIDPKRVELSMFAGVPHLAMPIVTGPERATVALQWLVTQMEARYQLLERHGFEHIDDYNLAAAAGELGRSDGTACEPLPYIVAVVDEFADMMMASKKQRDETEEAVVRVTQLARAAGEHLLLATQRPVKEVVTGLIKANTPTRFGFETASNSDSMVVLDQPGAEKLTGQGDCLFLPSGTSKPIRLQSAFVSRKEIQDVVRACKAQAASAEASC